MALGFEKAIYAVLTVVSFVCAVICSMASGARFGSFFFFCLGAAFFLITVFAPFSKRSRIAKVLLMIGRIVLAAWIVSFIAVQAFIISGEQTDAQAYDADLYIVLGAGVNGRTPSLSMISRLEAVHDVMESNPDSVAILTGGQGEGEDIPESHAMREWLIDHGIEESRLYVEDTSLNTIENLENARTIIKENKIDTTDGIAIVTNEFHLKRAKRLMELEGMESYGVAAETPYTYLKAVYHIREYFSVMGLFVTGRLF